MILLSFDIEEFDMPLEHGKNISLDKQIEVSVIGSNTILDLLKKHNIKATFFSTVIFALNAPEIIKRIKNEGHELASHTYYHSKFEVADLLASRLKLEELFGAEIYGFRMPRMMPVDEAEIEKAGYVYNSSINPTWLPGRYNNLHIPRTYYKAGNVMQLPASVSPRLRFPLFWLSFHNLPMWIYKSLVKRTYRNDGYVNLYFHPWEFTPLNDKLQYGFPNYVSRNSGDAMTKRMDMFMEWINKQGFKNGTINQFLSKL